MFRVANILLFLLCLPEYCSGQNRTVNVAVQGAGALYKFNYYNSDVGFYGQTVEAVVQDSRGSIWAASRTGVYKLNGVGVEEFNLKSGLPSEYIQCLEEGENNVMWIGTREGLASIDGKTVRNYVFDDTSMAGLPIWSLCMRSDGNLLIGTSHGIHMLKDDKIEFYMNIDTSTKERNLARFLRYDSKGILWAGCWNSVHRIDDKTKTILETFVGDVSLGWAEAKDGTVYFSAWGPGLRSYKDGALTTYNIGMSIPNVRIDPWGTVWLGTWENGLIRMVNDSVAIRYSVAEGLPTNTVWGLECDHEGRIWCGTYGGGICQLVDHKFSGYSRINGLEADVAICIRQDTASNVWVGSEGGLAMISPQGKVRAFGPEDGLLDNSVMDIDARADGTVHIVNYHGGTGYYEWDGTKLINHQRGGGMAIYLDSKGTLWEGQESQGVKRVSPDGTVQYFQEVSNKSKKRVLKSTKIRKEESGWEQANTAGI